MDDIEISERKGKLIVRSGKGGKSREIKLNTEARKALKDYLDYRAMDKVENVFIGERGPLKPSGVYRMLRKYAQQAGLHVTPHMMRHTFAYRLLRVSHDLVMVQKMLGHANINTTAIYTQPQDEDEERSLENLNTTR